jgi:hypothetical protein
MTLSNLKKKVHIAFIKAYELNPPTKLEAKEWR